MVIITVDDCLKLQNKFQNYCSKAEQHEFILLVLIEIKLNNTIEKIVKEQKVENQTEARTMFRTILKIIGEDYSMYEE